MKVIFGAFLLMVSGAAAATDWVDLIQQNNYLASPAASAGTLIWTGTSAVVTLESGDKLTACLYMAPHGQVVVLERGACQQQVTL